MWGEVARFGLRRYRLTAPKQIGRLSRKENRSRLEQRLTMTKRRDTYKYHFKVGNKIVHRGVTLDLERREREHQQIWPDGEITQIGHRTTREAALEWERKGGKGR